MTDLQMLMIRKIATSEYTPVNGDTPRTAKETETWRDTIIETPEDKGVFTSLLNAGLVWSSGRAHDAGCGLTEAGFAAFLTMQAS